MSKNGDIPHAGAPHGIGPRSVGGGPRRWILLLPVVAFIGLATALALGLNRDPRAIPSALIGRAVPTFQLPPVQGRARGLSSNDLKGDVSLVNVFPSSYVPSPQNHPPLMPPK